MPPIPCIRMSSGCRRVRSDLRPVSIGLKTNEWRAARMTSVAQRCALLAACLILAGCATAAQRQATQASAITREAAIQLKACIVAIRDKPAYLSLLRHLADLDTGQHTMRQLTDETLPTPAEAQLIAASTDDANICKRDFLAAISQARPDVVPVIADNMVKGNQIAVDLIERKITWGVAAGQTDANIAELRTKIADADQHWRAQLSASNQAEIAQRQAAASALLQWSEQQQMINALNRPVVTNCNRFGTSVNCTSY